MYVWCKFTACRGQWMCQFIVIQLTLLICSLITYLCLVSMQLTWQRSTKFLLTGNSILFVNMAVYKDLLCSVANSPTWCEAFATVCSLLVTASKSWHTGCSVLSARSRWLKNIRSSGWVSQICISTSSFLLCFDTVGLATGRLFSP